MNPSSKTFFTLNNMLPDRTQSTYNLRSRKHDCSLTVKHSVTDNDYLTRMLYKDMYIEA